MEKMMKAFPEPTKEDKAGHGERVKKRIQQEKGRNMLMEIMEENEDMLQQPEALKRSLDNIAEEIEKMDAAIDEEGRSLRGAKFEGIVDKLSRYVLAGNLLKEVSGTEEVVSEICNKKDSKKNRLLKTIKKHVQKYPEIDIDKRKKDQKKQIEAMIEEVNGPIEKREALIEKLEKLVISLPDNPGVKEELGSQTAKLEEEKELREEKFLEMAFDILSGTPGAEPYVEKLSRLKAARENKETGANKANWPILPVDIENSFKGGSSGGKKETGEKPEDKIDLSKSNYLKKLNGDKEPLVSEGVLEALKKGHISSEVRPFVVHLFPNCAVICPLTKGEHATFVIAKENWEKTTQDMSKEEVRARGARRLMDSPYWKKNVLNAIERGVEMDFNKFFMVEPRREWGTTEENKEIVHDVILEAYPEIGEAIKNKEFYEARILLSSLQLNDFRETGISTAVNLFGTLRAAIMAAFARYSEVGLVESDFLIKTPQFKWAGKTHEQKAENVKKGLKDMLGIDERYVEERVVSKKAFKEKLLSLGPPEFKQAGLVTVVTGGTGDSNFNDILSALRSTFPDYIDKSDSLTLKSKKGMEGKNLEERIFEWSVKVDGALNRIDSNINKLYSRGSYEEAKQAILGVIKKAGGWGKLKNKYFSGITNVKLKGGTKMRDWLEETYPLINWVGTGGRGRRIKKRV